MQQNTFYGIAITLSWYYVSGMTRAEVRELECFVAVAELLNFSKAARQLHLSQPPLTRHIQALEQKLGTRLLERNTHAVSVTEHGRLFLEDAKAILRHLDRANETIRQAKAGKTARLRLSFVGALLDEKLVRLIRQFRKKYPGCQVQVTDLPPATQLAGLEAREFDGGFIGAKPERLPKDLAFRIWRREPLVLALPERHPLLQTMHLRWTQLADHSWVMVTRSAAPAFRRQFTELMEAKGITARITEESDRLPAILTMVAAGSGLSMVPQTVGHLIPKGVVFRKLPPPQPMLLSTFAFQTEKSPALSNFLELMEQDLSN